MKPDWESELVVVHADESCLGNGMDGQNPGGAASLIEVRTADRILRFDLYVSSPATTNNRMALSGAIATFALLSDRGRRLRVAYVSDSQYLIKGMSEWVPTWRARGWRRKGGAIENLELWKTLVRVSAQHRSLWRWVRGHAGHAKNEYANDLAMRAASEQITSDGMVASGLDAWLATGQARGRFVDYDADETMTMLEAELLGRP